MSLFDFAAGELGEMLRPVPRRRKIERCRYVTRRAHGPFPAGTECWISRARPDAMLVLEYEGGSVVEASWGYAEMEFEPSWLARLFGVREASDVATHLMVRIAQWMEHG